MRNKLFETNISRVKNDSKLLNKVYKSRDKFYYESDENHLFLSPYRNMKFFWVLFAKVSQKSY
jgi:hypothetical protein